jgi:hypothetical protein
MKLTLPIAFVLVAFASNAYAQLSKEQCVDAHSRGQDAREQGKISLARKLFLTCAQNGCPAAVQGDCARFADDLTNLQPTIVFVARDGNGNDLPETTVYVDGALIATTIDGKPHDIDPGNHTVKFSNGGKDEVVTVVIGSGEKGRTVQAKFGSPTPPAPVVPPPSAVQDRPTTPKAPVSQTTHPTGAMALAVSGGALAVVGAAVAFYGKSKIPSKCDLGTHQCSAAPGDPVFADARSATKTMNMGIVAGSIGGAAAIGGLIWYFAGSKTTTESATQQAIAPWVNSTGGGVAISGSF